MPEIHGWRLTQPQHAEDAFNGEGASIYGGRWNHIGFPAVYAGSCASVTVMEVLVHFEISFLQRSAFSIIFFTLTIPSVTQIDRFSLPKNWRNDPPPHEITDMGTKWLQRAETPVLIVPSATVPQDNIYVLNPRHPNLKIRIERVENFCLDSRLCL